MYRCRWMRCRGSEHPSRPLGSESAGAILGDRFRWSSLERGCTMTHRVLMGLCLVGCAGAAGHSQVGGGPGPEPVTCWVCEIQCNIGTCAPSGITVCESIPDEAESGESGWTRIGTPYHPRRCFEYAGGTDDDYILTPCGATPPVGFTNIGPCGGGGSCCYVSNGITPIVTNIGGSIGTCKGQQCTGGAY
jgi:hypothetical protein